MAARRLSLTEALVALVERMEPKGREPKGLTALQDADYAPAAQALLARHPDPGAGQVWVFAYGSLLWKPAFAASAARPCLVHGWRRSFCLHLESWRGTPDQPGLMLALDRGGSCHGMAYGLTRDEAPASVEALLRREIGYAEDLTSMRWIRGRIGGAVLPVLASYAAPLTRGHHIRPTEAEQADRLAIAAGHMGSCAAYLHQTVLHLEALGIHDRYLWRLQRMVADRIAARRDSVS